MVHVFYRKLFKRPSFVSKESEIHFEKRVYMLQKNENSTIVSLLMSFFLSNKFNFYNYFTAMFWVHGHILLELRCFIKKQIRGYIIDKDNNVFQRSKQYSCSLISRKGFFVLLSTFFQ